MGNCDHGMGTTTERIGTDYVTKCSGCGHEISRTPSPNST